MGNSSICMSEVQLLNRLEQIVIIATEFIKEGDIEEYKDLINFNDKGFYERIRYSCVHALVMLQPKGKFDKSKELRLLCDELDNIIYYGKCIGIREKLENHMIIIFKNTVATIENNEGSGSSTIAEQVGEGLYSTVKEVRANSIEENERQEYNTKENVYKNENIDLKIEEIALNNPSFFRFVEVFSGLGDGALVRTIQNKYSYLKSIYGDNKSISLGCNGGIEFAGAILLCIHYEVRNNNSTYKKCINSIIYAFKGASPIMFSNAMDDVINGRLDMEYEEWSKVYRFLIDRHGKEIRELEFCETYTSEAHFRLKKIL